MKYGIFANTPAHVHLYKHVVHQIEAEGHDVTVFARDYGCTLELADAFEMPYTVYGRCGTTKKSLLRNLPRHYINIVKEVRRFDPDLLFGMGAYAAHAGAVSGTPTILVLDSEPTQLDHVISKPFADALLTPDSFRRDLGPNHYVFPGFKECAYLHPDVFEPDPSVRSNLGVGSDPFVIVRLNAFGSHHDVSAGGFTLSDRLQLIRDLSEHATVIVSDEGGNLDIDTLPAQAFDLPPERLHDTLAEAALLVADTQTMVTEAALLGTPAIRSNSFVGPDDMGNFIELADRGLIENCRSFEAVQSNAIDILTDDSAQHRHRDRAEALFEEKVNLTELLVDVAHNHSRLHGIEQLNNDWTPPSTESTESRIREDIPLP